MKSRQYIRLVVGSILVVLLFNFSVWFFVTRPVLTGDPEIGDLARIGYLPEIVKKDKTDGAPEKRHLNYWEKAELAVDVITIGDSFSQGGGSGYYQDWLATVTDLKVLNLNEAFWYSGLENRLDLVVNLLNDGFFDELQPKYLLIQNVERNSANLANVTDWSSSERADEFRTFFSERQQQSRLDTFDRKGFFNNTSFKYLLNRAWYFFTGHDLSGKVYLLNLKKDLFSGESPRELAFFSSDLKWLETDVDKTAYDVNENMNRLADLLRKKGIELLFLPTVDKYDLYHDYIIAPPSPRATFFDTLRNLPKRYRLVDSQRVLLPLLKKGEKDVFWQDDTHWSWKASAAISKDVGRIIHSGK